MTDHTLTRTKRYASVGLRWCICVTVVLVICLAARAYVWPSSLDDSAGYDALALGFAIALAVMIATFVEVILLFVRAAEGDHS